MAAPRTTRKASAAKGDLQAQVDHEQEKGYRGTKVDPLPNHVHTFAGRAEAKLNVGSTLAEEETSSE